jgi:hypothetical protein
VRAWQRGHAFNRRKASSRAAGSSPKPCTLAQAITRTNSSMHPLSRPPPGLTFALAPEAGDEVLTDSDLPIYIAEEVSAVLDHSVIDITADRNESRLVLRSQADAS